MEKTNILHDIDTIMLQRERDKKELLSMKIALEEKMGLLTSWELDFNFRLWMKGDEEYSRKKYFEQLSEMEEDDNEKNNECSEVSVWLRGIRPSYIGPA